MRQKTLWYQSRCGLAFLLLASGFSLAADPERVAAPPGAANRLTHVTVYPDSARVTRLVDVPAGPGQMELVVKHLPPSTVSGSLYSEGEKGIRVLQTRFRTRQIREDSRDGVRKLEEQLRALQSAQAKLSSERRTVEDNLELLDKLENYTVSTPERAPLDSKPAIELANYIMERREEQHQLLVELEEQSQARQREAEFTKRRISELASGSSRTEHDAVVVIERVNPAAAKVRLHYLVHSATWHPHYKIRAGDGAADAVQFEYLAGVVQQTGESWENVLLTLSTAQPARHAAPPNLQPLRVVEQHSRTAILTPDELQERARKLRAQALDYSGQDHSLTAARHCNQAAALDQCRELLYLNPHQQDAATLSREGPSVTFHLPRPLTVPSRNDEQVVEIARLEFSPDYYHKAIPVLSRLVYRQADLINSSDYVLLPGKANMHVGSDFVGQVRLPLVAAGEQFTVGFGVDTQVQIERKMKDKSRSVQGGNQLLSFQYGFLVSNYKSQRINLQLWDRLPHTESENVGIELVRANPAISEDPVYLREHRPENLLRWDLSVDPESAGEKAIAIDYEFELELDRQMTLSELESATTRAEPRQEDDPKVLAALARLSSEDRLLAKAQVYCAIKEHVRLGAVGRIQKVMIKNRPVLVCCGGCARSARENPDETLARVDRIMARVAK